MSLFSGFVRAMVMAVGAVMALPASAGEPLAGRWQYLSQDSDRIRERIVDRLIYTDRSGARLIDTPRGKRVIGIREVRPKPEAVDRMMRLLDQVVPLEPLVRIETDTQGVTVHYADGRSRRLCTACPDRRAAVQSTAQQGPQELVLAAWEEGRLTVETNTNAGLSVLEVYKRDKATSNLHVEFTIDSGRFPEPVEARYVYAPPGTRPAR